MEILEEKLQGPESKDENHNRSETFSSEGAQQKNSSQPVNQTRRETLTEQWVVYERAHGGLKQVKMMDGSLIETCQQEHQHCLRNGLLTDSTVAEHQHNTGHENYFRAFFFLVKET